MAWDTEHTPHKESVSENRGKRAPGRLWGTLQHRADFLRVRGAGLRRAMPGFVLQAAPAKPHISSAGVRKIRVGFTASKKVGNAVARNRAKRRLRALADRVMGECADPNFDYVLIARSETLRRDFASMEKELHRALHHVCTIEGDRENTAKAAESL
jgi:ribonuclease P protein component